MSKIGMTTGKWITVKRAALMLEVSKQRVYALIKSGHLGWMRMDGVVLVTLASVKSRAETKKGYGQ